MQWIDLAGGAEISQRQLTRNPSFSLIIKSASFRQEDADNLVILVEARR